MKVFLLALLVTVALSVHCPKYVCVSDMEGKHCANYTADDTTLNVQKSCSTEAKDYEVLTCPYQTAIAKPGSWIDCAAVDMRFKIAAQNKPLNDLENTCVNGEVADSICVGNTTDKNCKSTMNCTADLYCKGGKCVKGVELDGTCSATEPCLANLLCSGGKCVKYGSKDDGTDATDPRTCKSAYIDPDTKKCASGPYLKDASLSWDEGKSDVCKYSIDKDGKTVDFDANRTPYKTSVCQVNAPGKSYCFVGEGSSTYQDYWKAALDYYGETIPCQAGVSICYAARDVAGYSSMKGAKLYGDSEIPDCVAAWANDYSSSAMTQILGLFTIVGAGLAILF